MMTPPLPTSPEGDSERARPSRSTSSAKSSDDSAQLVTGGGGPLESLDSLTHTLPTSTQRPGAAPDVNGTSPPDPSSRRVGTDQPLLPSLQASALGLLDVEELQSGRRASNGGSVDHVRFDKRRTGTTKFFNASKGFGFILDHAPEELGNAEVFVHYTAIQAVQGGSKAFKSLLEGEDVSYLITHGSKGWQAQDVKGPTGGPCIGSPPSSAPPRAPFALPRSMGRRSSTSDFRNGSKNDRFDRRPSGMVGGGSSHGASHSARGDPRYQTMMPSSSRDAYSNMSSPPSQASSHLPPTPQSPYFYPLPPTMIGSPIMYHGAMPQPIFYASPHPDPHSLAYYPPTVLPPHPGAGYYSPPTGYSVPLPAGSPMPSIQFAQPIQHPPQPPEFHHYPISSSSSSQQNPSPHSKSVSIDSSPAPNPYSDLYGSATDDYRTLVPSYGYPISSLAS